LEDTPGKSCFSRQCQCERHGSITLIFDDQNGCCRSDSGDVYEEGIAKPMRSSTTGTLHFSHFAVFNRDGDLAALRNVSIVTVA
jgi:hypothetical protein